MTFLEHAVAERFVREDHRAMVIVEEEPEAMLERLDGFDPAALTPKWIDREDV
jgi:predicted Rossmann-fold nucleotide-binding protein